MDLCTTYGVQHLGIIDQVHPDHALVNYWLSQGFLVSCAFTDSGHTDCTLSPTTRYSVVAESFSDETPLYSSITRDHRGITTVTVTLVYFHEEKVVVEVAPVWIRTYLALNKIAVNSPSPSVTVRDARESAYGAFAAAAERGFLRYHPSRLPWEILMIRDPVARRHAAEAFLCSST